MRNQRRVLLKAVAGSIVSPRISFANTPTNPDVVIIGAGIAGIQAAKILHDKGRQFCGGGG